MSGRKRGTAASLMMIALGTGWLLTVQGFLPGVDWVYTTGLGMMGVLVLAFGGINRVTVAVGPMFMVGSFFSLLRQTGRLELNVEMPCLVIAAGCLMLLANVLPLRTPDWLVEGKEAGIRK